MDDGIYFSDMRKELIAQALTFIRTAHESRNVDKLYRCGRELFRIIHFCEYVEPLVRDGDYADIWVDCAERIVRGLRTGLR